MLHNADVIVFNHVIKCLNIRSLLLSVHKHTAVFSTAQIIRERFRHNHIMFVQSIMMSLLFILKDDHDPDWPASLCDSYYKHYHTNNLAALAPTRSTKHHSTA
jgi:hypothetical protein